MMKRYTGAIILIVLIAIPLLWVGVLKKGKIKYTPLPIYNEVVFGDTVPLTIDSFELIDQNGLPFTQDSIGDRLVVANFFFTSCPDICPAMNSNVKILTEQLKSNPYVVFLSHSVDPETDSVPVLKQYADDLEAMTGQWHFLTGKKREIYDLASQQYRVVSVEQGKGTFIHSEKLVLIDKERQIRGYYEGRDYMDIKKLRGDIKILFKEYKDNEEG